MDTQLFTQIVILSFLIFTNYYMQIQIFETLYSLTFLKYAWGLCLDRSINTVLSVDEAHVLLSGSNELGADFLAQVQRRARKYNTGTIIMTQQPSDFSDPKVITQGKAIFDNAAYYLIMNLKTSC